MNISRLFVVLVPSFVLGLISHLLFKGWQSPIFSFFTVIIVLIFSLILFSSPKNFRIQFQYDINDSLDYVALAISLVVLLTQFIHSGFMLMLIVPLTIIASMFLPGFVLFRIFGLDRSFSFLENFVLFFLMSIPITALTGITFTTLLPSEWKSIALAIFYLFLSLMPLCKKITKGQKKAEKEPKELKNFDSSHLIALFIVFAFFVCIMTCFYPGLGMYPGADSVRHYSSTQLIGALPSVYHGEYPWFVFQWYVIHLLSGGPSMSIFFSFIPLLSSLIIVAFYVLTREYLHSVDRRLPPLSTLVFSLFSGFGWVTILDHPMPVSFEEQYNILHQIFAQSYFQIGYGLSSELWFWFRPQTIGTIAFLILLFLFKRKDTLPSRIFIGLFATVLAIMGIIHPPELVFFVALFPFFVFFISQEDWTNSIYAALIGLALVSTFNGINYWLFGLGNTSFFSLLPILGIALIGSLLCNKFNINLKNVLLKLKLSLIIRYRYRLIKYSILMIAIAYVALLLTWSFSFESFEISLIGSDWYPVPIIYYPALLGIVGLLGISVIGKSVVRNKYLIILVIVLLSLVVQARILNWINSELFMTRYSERRMLFLISVPLTMFTSLVFVEIQKFVNTKFILEKTRLFVMTTTLCVIVFLGFSAVPLTFSHNYYAANELRISDDGLNLATQLDALLEKNPNVAIYTLDPQSRLEAEFSHAPWMMYSLTDPFWNVQDPESALRLTYSDLFEKAYIYLPSRDLKLLQSDAYSHSFIKNHLTSFPLLFKDDSGEIREIVLSPPSIKNASALILPNIDNSISWEKVADLLSLGNLFYTTYLEDDIALKHQDSYIYLGNQSQISDFPLKSNVLWVNLDGNAIPDSLKQENTFLSIEDVSAGNASSIRFFPFKDDFDYFEISAGYNPAIVQLSNQKSSITSTLEISDIDKWEVSAWGVGSVGIPEISLDPSLNLEHNTPLLIEIGAGGYDQWALKLPFDSAKNISSSDYVSFDWWGQNTGKQLLFEILAPSSSDSILYYFEDDWVGKKQIILPLKVANGEYTIEGIKLVISRIGTPTLSEVKSIQIRNPKSPPPGSPNLSGAWHFGSLALHESDWVSINVKIHGDTEGKSLLVSLYDGESYEPLLINDLTRINASELFTSQGFNLGNLFGCSPAGIIAPNEPGSINLSFKIPSLREIDDRIYSLLLKFSIEGSEIVSKNIGLGDLSITIPFETHVIPARFEDEFNEVAWYVGGDGMSPLLAKGFLGGFNVTWLNLEPLMLSEELSNVERSEFTSFYKTLISSLPLELTQLEFSIDPPLVEKDLLAFTDAQTSGKTTVTTSSGIITLEPSQNIEAVIDNKPFSINNVSKIKLWSDKKFTLTVPELNISEGLGFYSKIECVKGDFISESDSVDISFLTSSGEKNFTADSFVFSLSKFEGLFRNPELVINGSIKFNNAYAYWKNEELLRRASGHDIRLEGNIGFSVIFSDYYTGVTDFNFSGVLINSPLVEWSEIEILKKYFIPIFIGSIGLWAVIIFLSTEKYLL